MLIFKAIVSALAGLVIVAFMAAAFLNHDRYDKKTKYAVLSFSCLMTLMIALMWL